MRPLYFGFGGGVDIEFSLVLISLFVCLLMLLLVKFFCLTSGSCPDGFVMVSFLFFLISFLILFLVLFLLILLSFGVFF